MMELDQKALEAARLAVCDADPYCSDAEAISETAIRAYLASLPSDDEVGRVVRLLNALVECDDEHDAKQTCDEAAALIQSQAAELAAVKAERDAQLSETQGAADQEGGTDATADEPPSDPALSEADQKKWLVTFAEQTEVAKAVLSALSPPAAPDPTPVDDDISRVYEDHEPAAPEGRWWHYKINYGPDGEENYANVYAPGDHFVGNLKIHHARAIVGGLNDAALSRPTERAVTEAMVEAFFAANHHELAEPSDTERRKIRNGLTAALAQEGK